MGLHGRIKMKNFKDLQEKLQEDKKPVISENKKKIKDLCSDIAVYARSAAGDGVATDDEVTDFLYDLSNLLTDDEDKRDKIYEDLEGIVYKELSNFESSLERALLKYKVKK